MRLSGSKIIYLLLGGALMIGVIGFVLYTNQDQALIGEKSTYSYTTVTGKKVFVRTEEAATSSKVIVTTEGFEANVPMVIKKEILTDVFFTDLNGDTFEELILIFSPRAPGDSGDISVFTTFTDSELTAVEVPEITELDEAPGMLFEGYMGGDIFLVEENTLFRNFLVRDLSAMATENQESEVEDATIEDVASSSEVATNEAEAIPQAKQKQISYALVSSEGLFYLEPQEVNSVKVFTASSTATLANTSWTWLSVNYEGSVTSSDAAHPLIFSFNENNTFSASSSCEGFTGSYILSGYLLRLGSISTDYLNEDPTCKNQAQLLKDTLPLSESFVIRDNQLMINFEENKGVVLLIRR